MTDPLGGTLRDLYARQRALLPHDDYFHQHAEAEFVSGTLRVFRFYEPYLPRAGRILDWGCHHAPDACLMRAHPPAIRYALLAVRDCNRNGSGLQSRHFWDRIICLYPAPQDHITCD